MMMSITDFIEKMIIKKHNHGRKFVVSGAVPAKCAKNGMAQRYCSCFLLSCDGFESWPSFGMLPSFLSGQHLA